MNEERIGKGVYDKWNISEQVLGCEVLEIIKSGGFCRINIVPSMHSVCYKVIRLTIYK
jgi:hypothetical protein